MHTVHSIHRTYDNDENIPLIHPAPRTMWIHMGMPLALTIGRRRSDLSRTT